MKRNWLDRTVGFFSPHAELRRMQARLGLDMAVKHYEAATMGRRTNGWRTPSTSANAAIGGTLAILRDRSRDLCRNNKWGKRGIDTVEINIVEAGILAKILAPNPKRTTQYKNAWVAWAESTQCDYDGVCNFYALQSLVARSVVESGEVLIRKRYAKSSDKLVVPMQLQVLEPDYLNSYAQASNKDNTVIMGIEYNSRGRRVGYHLYVDHPGNYGGFNLRASTDSNFIPADEIIHCYDILRPGQVRGVPWLAPAMISIKDFDDYEDAQLFRQKIAACFTAFVHDNLDDPEAGTVLGDDALGDKLEPGAIQYLPPGKDIKFASPPGVDGYKETQTITLQGVAAALGVSFEALTQDYSNVNFSSARMGRIEFNKMLNKWRWQIFIPRFCEPAFAWFREASLYAGFNPDEVYATWTPPKYTMIDPTKEVPAKIEEIRGGLTSWQEAVRENGNDPDDQIAQMVQDNKNFDSNKLILDSDPRKTTGKGQLYIAGGPNDKTPTN